MIENSSEYKSLLKKVEEYRAQDEAREKCFKESKKRSVQSLLVLEQNLKVNCKLLAPGASKLNNADYPIIKMMTEHRVYCMKNEKEYQIILVPYFCDGDGNILESDDNSWVLLTGDEHLKDYYHAIADDF